MTVSLGDELVVALAVQPQSVPGRPPGATGFSLPDLVRLTGRSLKAVEEALYDLHRAGLVIVKVEVKASVVRVVGATLTAGGNALVDRRLEAVQRMWQERASEGRLSAKRTD